MKINPIIGTTLTMATIFLLQVNISSCGSGSGGSTDSNPGGGGGSPKGKMMLAYKIRNGILSLRCKESDCRVSIRIDSNGGSPPTNPGPKYLVTFIPPHDPISIELTPDVGDSDSVNAGDVKPVK